MRPSGSTSDCVAEDASSAVELERFDYESIKSSRPSAFALYNPIPRSPNEYVPGGVMVFVRRRGPGCRAIHAIYIASAALWLLSQPLVAQTISTVAGGGSDDGRPATLASLKFPNSVALDSAGNLYVADHFNSVIRRIDADTGIITTVAGDGSIGFGGDGGPATKASLFLPQGIAFSPEGHLYVADSNRIRRIDAATGTITSTHEGFGTWGLAFDSAGHLYVSDLNNEIRRIDAVTGIVTTVAGNGERGFSGDGGPATQASIRRPWGVTIGPDGDLYFADFGNHRIRRVDMASGIIDTIAGNGQTAFSGDGGLATQAALDEPRGLTFDPAGHLYIADAKNHRVRRVDAATGVITTIAGDGGRSFNGDGGPAIQAGINTPTDVAIDAGYLYIVERSNFRLRRVDLLTGIITTVAGNGKRDFTGDGSPATQALVAGPSDVAIDLTGNLFIAESLVNVFAGERIRRVDAETGIITTIAGMGESGFAGDGGPATAAHLSSPEGVGIDPVSNVYIADSGNDRIRRVDAVSGVITTYAGNGDGAFSGDDGPAKDASLNSPRSVAIDSAGNLYIADTRNDRVRRVDFFLRFITTVAGNGDRGFSGDGGPATLASLDFPENVAIGPDGNLFITVQNPPRVRRVDISNGIITTVAGGGMTQPGDGDPATSALLRDANGLALDADGNLYFADAFGARIRRVDVVTGIITTVAGNGIKGFTGDGGSATLASLSSPVDVALDSSGNLFIADNSASRVRAVFACVEMSEPQLSSPSDGSQGLPLLPSLAWEAMPGAFGWDVYLDDQNPPQRIIAADTRAISFSPTNLEPRTTYYWKVRAKGDALCEPFRSAESEVRSFTTTSSCQIPGAFDTN